MTAYSATTTPTALYPGDTTKVWNVEAVTSGGKSRQVALFRSQEGTPQSVSVEILFSGDPGTMEVDLQTADTDADAAYETIAGNVLNSVDSAFRARGEFNVTAKFARLLAVTVTNAVNLTGNITQ